jgi:hypothetical protein
MFHYFIGTMLAAIPSSVLWVNGVSEGNGSNNPKTRQCTPHSILNRVMGSVTAAWELFHLPYANILRVHITRKMEPCLI